ncbi:MAG: Pr6Pr family membrane protein [Hyphomonadaceae bacterium]
MSPRAAHLVAIIGALAGLAGLALQFAVLFRNLSSQGDEPLAIVWRFIGYFTILTNMLITAILAGAALRPNQRQGLNAPVVEAIGVAGILLVGGAYHALLADRWDPQGAQLAADIMLHSVMPLLFGLFWLLRPHGDLGWRDALICMVWPLGYCAYALVRGAFDGFYAYWFLDPLNSSLGEMIRNIAGLSTAFLVGALGLVAIDKALARTLRPAAP